MKGLIVRNGYYTSENEDHRCKKLVECFLSRGVEVDVYNNRFVWKEEDFRCYDFCLFFDKDVYLSSFLQNCGIRMFNDTNVLIRTDNKIETYLFLKGKGVEMPATVPAPKKFFYVQDREYLDAVASFFGYPLVVKEAYGSLGKQVYLISDAESLYKTDEETGTKDKLYQSFYKYSQGESVRIICIGGKAIGGMKLSSKGDFRSNAHLGGQGENFPLTDEYKKAAEKVADLLGADYVGIDFFADKPVLIEVNGNAYYKQFEQVTGIDVTRLYVDYILESLSPRDGI